MKLEFYRQSLEKSSNINCHEHPSSRSRVVTSKRTEGQTDVRTDMTKLIVAFRNFANASKNQYFNSGVPHKVCQTAGCYCTSYFEYKHYINIYQIINCYTVNDFEFPKYCAVFIPPLANTPTSHSFYSRGLVGEVTRSHAPFLLEGAHERHYLPIKIAGEITLAAKCWVRSQYKGYWSVYRRSNKLFSRRADLCTQKSGGHM